MRILIAPDKFKDALDAIDVCAAMASGVRAALPDAEIISCPLADGGEGTGPLLAGVLGAQPRTALALDPLGHERSARWWLTPTRDIAVIEMAEASGLWLLDSRDRKATQTTSYGTGQLIQAAIKTGAKKVVLCAGGSATVDGGAGCLQALGCELLDENNHVIEIPICGRMLARVRSLRLPAKPPAMEIEILVDVDNPLLGSCGAAPVFAPQKGASSAEIDVLDKGLAHWAEVLERCTGCNVRDLSGGGAAGGLPAGLVAALNARLLPGFDSIADRLGLDALLSDCDLCLTGEGRLDEQTLAGKVVGGVARRACAAGVPVVAFAGAVQTGPGRTLDDLVQDVGVTHVVVITPPEITMEQALAQTADNLRRGVAEHVSL